MLDKTLFEELKKSPVWTVNKPGTKVPYDLIRHESMSDRSHVMTLSRAVAFAKQQNMYDGTNMACLNDVRKSHLLMLDLEKDASVVWRNFVLSLPLAYVEASVHGGLHALMIVTDEQLTKHANVFSKTVLQLGNNADLEVFANGKHFCSFTGKQVPTLSVDPQTADGLRDNLLTQLDAKAVKAGASNVDVHFTELKPWERKFGNQMYKFCTVDRFRKSIAYANQFTDRQTHRKEFSLIGDVMQRIAFMAKKSRFKTNLSAQSLIQITAKISRGLMVQLGWQRDKWNDRYREGDYIMYETVRAYVKNRLKDTYCDYGELKAM